MRLAAVIVFANRGDVALAERVAWNLVDILLGNDPQLKLPALGQSSAKARAGRFESPEALRYVLGMGPKKLAAIRRFITVSD